MCLLKIFTERSYFLPPPLYARSPAVWTESVVRGARFWYRADSCRHWAGVLINHIRCSRDRKAVLPYAHGAEQKSAVKSSDQGKTCVLPEVNIITVGSVAVFVCNVGTSVDRKSATCAWWLAPADVHSECSDMEKTFELPTCRHHRWRCRSFACRALCLCTGPRPVSDTGAEGLCHRGMA